MSVFGFCKKDFILWKRIAAAELAPERGLGLSASNEAQNRRRTGGQENLLLDLTSAQTLRSECPSLKARVS